MAATPAFALPSQGQAVGFEKRPQFGPGCRRQHGDAGITGEKPVLALDGVPVLSAPVLWRRHLLDGSDDQAFIRVGGAAAGAFRVAAATNEGFVCLQKAVQRTRRILAQPMAQLVRHRPGRLIRHTEFALQKLGRNSALIAAHQIGGKKPLGQIGPRPMQYRSGGRRFLPVAGRTFIHSRARLQPPGLTSAAPSTGKAAGPAKPRQVFNALLLAPKLDNKLSQSSH